MAADAHISNQEYVNISGMPLWLLMHISPIKNMLIFQERRYGC